MKGLSPDFPSVVLLPTNGSDLVSRSAFPVTKTPSRRSLSEEHCSKPPVSESGRVTRVEGFSICASAAHGALRIVYKKEEESSKVARPSAARQSSNMDMLLRRFFVFCFPLFFRKLQGNRHKAGFYFRTVFTGAPLLF